MLVAPAAIEDDTQVTIFFFTKKARQCSFAFFPKSEDAPLHTFAHKPNVVRAAAGESRAAMHIGQTVTTTNFTNLFRSQHQSVAAAFEELTQVRRHPIAD